MNTGLNSRKPEDDRGAPPWWRPEVHADRRPFLIARTRIVAELRRYFATHGFIEVDFGAIVPSPGAEVHVSAFATETEDADGQRTTRYLHTSPEFAAKKLLAAGETRIVSLGHVYRNRERTALHAPEFTMVEWYRATEPYEAVMADTVALVRAAATAAEAPRLVWRDRTADPAVEPVRLTMAEAFRRFAEIDLLATIAANGHGDRDSFAVGAERAGVETAPDDTWSDIFARVLAERVEPGIAALGVVLLTDYPAPEAALARRSPRDPRTAERFELYVAGVEIANGFGELTDPIEQRARFEADMDEKARRYGVRWPIDEDLLDALAHMPSASGVALGLDRLVMLATGARHIDQVIWTPLR